MLNHIWTIGSLYGKGGGGLWNRIHLIAYNAKIGTSGRHCSRSALGGRLATMLVDRYFHHYFPFFFSHFFFPFSILRRDLFS